MRTVRLFVVVLMVSSAALADRVVLDECESADDWRVIASEGVEAHLRAVEGQDGRGLRLDFDFRGTAGFCVVRRELALTLPANYRFSYAVRGEAPDNNLEFKLVDGDNVWWVNHRAFELPAAWSVLHERARNITFAWGPSGGTPLVRINAVELAVSAAKGGKGYMLFDQLTFEALPSTPAAGGSVRVSTSEAPDGLGEASEIAASRPAGTLESDGALSWTVKDGGASPWLQLDFGGVREVGGLALEWGATFAPRYEVRASLDGHSWETLAAVQSGNGGRDYVRTPGAEAAYVRIEAPRGGFELRRIRVMEPSFGDSHNEALAFMAREAPRGLYPRYLLGEQAYWTVSGLPDDEREALLDTDGAVEFDKHSARIEPSIFLNDRLYTWADADRLYALANGFLPIPTVTWRLPDGIELSVTVAGERLGDESVSFVQYRLTNRSGDPLQGTLFLAIRPLQVLPPWQALNMTGGFTRVDGLVWENGRVDVRGRRPFVVQTGAAGARFGAAVGPAADVSDWLALGSLPNDSRVSDPSGMCSGALAFDFSIAGGRSAQFAVGLSGGKAAEAVRKTVCEVESRVGDPLPALKSVWERELNRVRLELPPAARRLTNTFRTTLGYILTNADGPAIQPGSRTYERSWIRDGALTSTALLHTGHSERVRSFIDWYAAHQFPSGKIPCVVDQRGADPVDEHDSTGEFLYLLSTYHAFTRDRELVERHFGRVAKAVEYLNDLRGRRLTPEYATATDWRAACRGLVPESISHEGYSAKPMHSYWDDFWTLRGLKSAVALAGALGRDGEVRRFSAICDDFGAALAASIERAMGERGIDFIPGCVELGDFDATSTAVGVWPCGDARAIPAAALQRTFEKYYEFFQARRAASADWTNFTPYEMRLVGVFVRLGQRDRARELLDFFMKYQRPPGWNHWAEVVWREAAAPNFIGDMPHTWCGSEFINSVRAMFVYEREEDASLILAAGVRPEWVTSKEGVRVGGFPSVFGPVTYTLSASEGRVRLELQGGLEVPAGGVRFRSPLEGTVTSATIDGVATEVADGGWVTLRRAPAVIEAVQAP